MAQPLDPPQRPANGVDLALMSTVRVKLCNYLWAYNNNLLLGKRRRQKEHGSGVCGYGGSFSQMMSKLSSPGFLGGYSTSALALGDGVGVGVEAAKQDEDDRQRRGQSKGDFLVLRARACSRLRLAHKVAKPVS